MADMKPPKKETANYSAHGDLGHNPQAILDQESRGTKELREFETLPTDGCSTPEEIQKFKDLGFKIGDPFPNDPMFREATLPEGWAKQPHKGNPHFYTDIVDETGTARFLIFYKAAAYDRSADIREAY